MEILYAIFFFCLFAFLIKTKLSNDDLSANLLLFAFSIKSLVGVFFIYYFLNIGFKPGQPSDVYRFLNESKMLNDVFYKSPLDYFKLLFGFKDYYFMNPEYFKDAFIWKTGNFSFISDTRNLIRVHSVIQFISFNNPYIHILIFNFECKVIELCIHFNLGLFSLSMNGSHQSFKYKI